MTKRIIRTKSVRRKHAAKSRSLPRTARGPKPRSTTTRQPEMARTGLNPEQPATTPIEGPKPEPIDHAAADALRDLDDTQRMLARPYQYIPIGDEDHGDLSDIVYAGFGGAELTLEIGMLNNLSMMANGLVQAVLAGTGWMSHDEFRHYTYVVARDIRERARHGAHLLDLRESGLKKQVRP